MESLIINKRHELPKTKRLVWDTVTVFLWIGFIYLWKPALHIFYRIITLDAPTEEIADWIYGEIHSVTFWNAIKMLIITPVILFLLSRLNHNKTQSEHLVFHFNHYADYFQIEKAHLKKCLESNLITVYFDEQGQIIKVENNISNLK